MRAVVLLFYAVDAARAAQRPAQAHSIATVQGQHGLTGGLAVANTLRNANVAWDHEVGWWIMPHMHPGACVGAAASHAWAAGARDASGAGAEGTGATGIGSAVKLRPFNSYLSTLKEGKLMALLSSSTLRNHMFTHSITIAYNSKLANGSG